MIAECPLLAEADIQASDSEWPLSNIMGGYIETITGGQFNRNTHLRLISDPYAPWL